VFWSGIFISADSGQTWAATSAPTGPWRSVASSADGATLVAGGGGLGRVYAAQFRLMPTLKLVPAGPIALISWIVPSTSAQLQENSDLATATWSDVTTVPTLSLANLENQVTVPTNKGQRFYRLRGP